LRWQQLTACANARFRTFLPSLTTMNKVGRRHIRVLIFLLEALAPRTSVDYVHFGRADTRWQ